MKKYIMLQGLISLITITTLNINQIQYTNKLPKKPTYNSPYIMEVKKSSVNNLC